MRTPSVLVSRSIASATARSSLGPRERRHARSPAGRSSSAPARSRRRARPAAKHAAAASGASSGSRSSRLASISDDRCRAALGVAADDHPHDVRQRRQVARAGAVADAPRASSRGSGPNASASAATSAAPVGVTSSDLDLDAVRAARPRAARASPGAGSGSRPCAASTKPAARPAAASTRRASTPRLSSASATPHDLADRVDRADLVEVHALGVDAVDAPLGVREPAERLLRPGARALGEPGGVDLRADRGPVAVRLRRPRRRTVTRVAVIPWRSPSRVAAQAFHAQPGEPALDRRRVRARVEQRPEQHVAGDAADAVDVERCGSRAPPPPRDPRGDRARSEPVVDVDDGDAGGARASASPAAR